MNSELTREYYFLRTASSSEAIGVVTMIRPTGDATTLHFSLHRPQDMHKGDEFMDLTYTSADYAEFETHRDAFKTLPEMEIVETYYASPSMTNDLYILVKQADTNE